MHNFATKRGGDRSALLQAEWLTQKVLYWHKCLGAKVLLPIILIAF